MIHSVPIGLSSCLLWDTAIKNQLFCLFSFYMYSYIFMYFFYVFLFSFYFHIIKHFLLYNYYCATVLLFCVSSNTSNFLLQIPWLFCMCITIFYASFTSYGETFNTNCYLGCFLLFLPLLGIYHGPLGTPLFYCFPPCFSFSPFFCYWLPPRLLLLTCPLMLFLQRSVVYWNYGLRHFGISCVCPADQTPSAHARTPLKCLLRMRVVSRVWRNSVTFSFADFRWHCLLKMAAATASSLHISGATLTPCTPFGSRLDRFSLPRWIFR